ncbi:MAG: T9SS type A sorting domain-containing protein [Flavobacteriales bacterium]
MNKLVLLGIVGITFVPKVNSQITIGPSDMPVANDTVVISTAINQWAIDPTVTGQNFSWDYSFLTHINIQLDTFKTVSSFPLGYQFYFNNQIQYPAHKANFGLRGQDINIPGFISITNVHDFYKVDNQGYKNVGYGATLQGFPLSVRNIPIDTVYKFPLNYGDVYDSYSESELNIPSLGFYGRKKSVDAEVDGWGEVETPYGVFDCLRIKLIINQVDSIYIDQFSFGISIPRPTETQYHWLTNGQKIPVLQINEIMGQITAIRYKDFPRNVSLDNPSKLVFNLSPNPSSDFVLVTLPDLQTGNVELMSLNGQVISRFDLVNSNSFRIDLNGINSGFYFVKVSSGNSFGVKKLVVQ